LSPIYNPKQGSSKLILTKGLRINLKNSGMFPIKYGRLPIRYLSGCSKIRRYDFQCQDEVYDLNSIIFSIFKRAKRQSIIDENTG